MKQKVLIPRVIAQEVVDRLSTEFEVLSNQNDESWSREDLLNKLKGCHGFFTTGTERIDSDLLAVCSDLKICSNMGVGFNNFDLLAMTSFGVLATNSPDVLTETTADFGFALVMATARRISESENFLRKGLWQRSRFDLFAGSEVHGSTLGIMGMGRIGQGIAKRGAYGFGMKVIYHNRTQLDASTEINCQAKYVSKESLLAQADHLVLVLPYSAATHHAISTKELALMKPAATLINIARGGIVDDVALALALKEGRLSGAGLDVFEGEPRVHPDLLATSNVVLTPHIASSTIKTRLAMANSAANNLIAYLKKGQALTPLNPEVMQGGKTP